MKKEHMNAPHSQCNRIEMDNICLKKKIKKTKPKTIDDKRAKRKRVSERTNERTNVNLISQVIFLTVVDA